MTTDPSLTTDPALAVGLARPTTNRTIVLQAQLARRRRARIVGAVGFAVVAVVAIVAVWDPLDRGERPMPTDAEVRQLWQSRRADFEALRAMIDADRALNVVGEDRVEECRRDAKDRSWSCPNAAGLDVAAMLQAVHLPVDRYAQYRTHLTAVGGDRAARRGDGITVGLLKAGAAPSESGKNVVWSPTTPAPMVSDTDRDHRGPPASYATLADGWYIEHEGK
jgi:hypothetical protein